MVIGIVLICLDVIIVTPVNDTHCSKHYIYIVFYDLNVSYHSMVRYSIVTFGTVYYSYSLRRPVDG